MTSETLRYIKKEIRKLCKAVEAINKCSDRDVDTLIKVLLHNAMFENPTYDHEESVSKLKDIQNALLAIAEYQNSYYERWIAQEVDMIISGNEMAEDYNDESITNSVEDEISYNNQYSAKPSESLPNDPFEYITNKLREAGYDQIFIGHELKLMCDYPGKTGQLTDSTCSILSSSEYLENYGSWQS